MRNKIFAYVVLGLNVVASWISWWILAGVIFGDLRHIWLFPILGFGAWAIAFTLSAIFVKDRRYLYGTYFLSSLGYIFFITISWSLIIVVLMVVFLIGTERQIKKELRRGITIDFYHLVSHSLRYFVSAVCIVIAVAYYLSITHRSPSPVAIEKSTLEKEIDWGLKAAGMVLPDEKKALIEDIGKNMSVDDFLSKNFVEPEFQEFLDGESSASYATKMIGNAATVEIQKQMLSKSKKDLAKQLGVDVVGEQPMKNVLMAYIDKTERSFFEYSGTEKFYIPIILASGIFLTARILGTIVDIFLGFLIVGIIKILRATDVIRLGSEQKEVVMVEYSI